MTSLTNADLARLPERYRRVVLRRIELADSLAAPGLKPELFSQFSREYADLATVAEAITAYGLCLREESELANLWQDAELSQDNDLRAMVEHDQYALKKRLPELEHAIRLSLLPKDVDDEKSAILEVRAGTGGEEAALFAQALFRMYRRYAELKGWRWETLEFGETDLGGLKEGVASIEGRGVFSRLKFESGVHRVQRVPETEASGRVHTSAATVAVLPEAEEVDIAIEDKDLRIDTYRASGAGGQHVNKTDSAVRITHIPTGLAVASQAERSQHKNRAMAMKILRARLYEQERARAADVRANDRKSQVGSGDRSERIRTYNFPQGRVSDHRLNLTLYKIEAIMTGEALDEIIDPLMAHDVAERLAADLG
jgi:peptide chain release factor 1